MPADGVSVQPIHVNGDNVPKYLWMVLVCLNFSRWFKRIHNPCELCQCAPLPVKSVSVPEYL
jgi:hypothetical protein